MMERRVLVTEHAPGAIGPYSQAIACGGFVFCSGQIGMDLDGNLVSGELEDEVRQAMENVGAVLAAAGAGFDDVVQATLYLSSMNDFARVNAVYAEYFNADPPARACIAAAALPKGARFEIVVTALTPHP